MKCKLISILTSFFMEVEIVKQMMDSGIKGIILKNYADGNSNVSRPDSDIPNINELYDYAAEGEKLIIGSACCYTEFINAMYEATILHNPNY